VTVALKLPEIEYGRGVPSVGNAYERTGAAAQRFSGVVAEGLAAMGRELVKTQAQKATADLHEGLAALENDLSSQRYVSVDFVRKELGSSFESLPPEVRAQLVRKQQGENGDTTDVDLEEVPTWVVAGALYEKRSKELIRAASQKITGQGWQAEFQNAALSDLVSRRAKVAHDAASAMMADQQQTQRATIQQYVRLGAHDRALEVIERSAVFTPGEKALLVEDVLKVRKEDDLIARAEKAAREIEAAHAGEPQAAMKAAQDVPGELGVKVQQRVAERDRLREEAQNDEVRDRKGRLELGVRTSQLVSVRQLEQLEDYRRLPEWAQADIVAIMGSVAEQRLRLSQLSSEKEWQQELSRFQGLSDREKVASWPAYQAKVPFAYSGQFAQVYQTATTRLTNAWDTEDVQKTFDLAAGVMKWTGPKKVWAEKVRERGRRWYDAETRRRNGIPPTQPEAAKWLAEQLQFGDQNGDAFGGGSDVLRFEAEAEAERRGEPVKFVPFNPEKQKYAPAALLLRGGAPAAQPPAAAPAAAPVPAAAPARPAAGTRARSEELGLPPGGVFEMQANGKWKRVQ
jgi:hypothetical protein